MESVATDLVLHAIPHRPPFLFVDSVVSSTAEGLVAERTLRATESFFAGHYPGNPIMPGVLICESIFQAAAIYLSQKLEASGQPIVDKVPVLVRIENARFRRMVRPGEKMQIEVAWKETAAHFHFMKGKASVDGAVALSIEFALGLVEKNTTA